MNKKLIKHIVITELKWRSKHLARAFMISSGALLFYKLAGAGEDLFILFLLFGFLLPFVAVFTSSILAPAVQQINQPSQSGFFSWKYLHTIVHDRKSFLIGYCLAGVACSLPLTFIAFGATLITKFPTSLFYIGLIPFFLLVAFIRLGLIYNVIHYPRSTYYKYNEDDGFMGWLKSVALGIHKFIRYGVLAATVVLIVAFASGFGIVYAFIVSGVCLLVLLKMLYEYVLLIWADERFSQWIPKREAKRSSAYIFTLLVFIVLNSHFHGRLYEDTDEIFDLIKDKRYAELKRLTKDRKVLDYTKKNLPPLHYAIQKGDRKAFQILLDAGADPDYKLRGKFKNYHAHLKGMTALLLAIDFNHSDFAMILIEKGVDLKAKNHDGIGALSLASFRCNMPIFNKLIELKADVNEQSNSGLTPLHYSAQGKGCLTSLLYLQKLGADETIKSKDGKTYVKYAKEINPIFSTELDFYKKQIGP